jgi:hypothetical protein
MAWINPHAKTTAYLERKEKKRAEREELFAKEREIKETNLLEQSGLSIWVFKKLKPHLLELYSEITYSKKKKKYSYNNNELSLSFLD